MRIIGANDGRILSLGKIIGLRVLPISLAAHIPIVGGFVGLIDALFIFGSEKRCLHDYIAGTIVVDA